MNVGTCSEQSCAVGEGLAGTAAEASSWLLLEYADEWKPKAYEQAMLPDATRSVIDAATRANPRLRVQLIRRSERRIGGDGVKLFLARSERGQEQLWEFTLPSYEALASVELSAWAVGGDPFASARRAQSLYIVCVHGKRDRCCAQKGMPVYKQLASLRPEQTWQTTHLGGHRFAATLTCLPEGLCYGRVEDHEVRALVEAHERGELHALERYRGRSCDAPETQAAESLLRAELKQTRIDAIAPTGSELVEGAHAVTFAARDGGVHTLRIERTKLADLQQSCDAEERKPGLLYVRC